MLGTKTVSLKNRRKNRLSSSNLTKNVFRIKTKYFFSSFFIYCQAAVVCFCKENIIISVAILDIFWVDENHTSA